MTSIRNGKKDNKEIYFSLFFYIESFVYNKGNRNNTNEAKEIFFKSMFCFLLKQLFFNIESITVY
jgi:hypothetical protein